jgi:hypothetical protein
LHLIELRVRLFFDAVTKAPRRDEAYNSVEHMFWRSDAEDKLRDPAGNYQDHTNSDDHLPQAVGIRFVFKQVFKKIAHA